MHFISRLRPWALMAALAAFGSTAPAWAEDTLARIASSGELKLGHREKSLPFSFKDANGAVKGYTVDVCLQIFDEIKKELKRPDLRVHYLLVDGKNRISDVKDGVVDLECGGTANTAARQKEIAFSHHIFVATSSFLVRKSSGIKTLDDLQGKKIAVQGKTTNEGLLRANERTYNRHFNYVLADSTLDVVGALVKGEADAAFADDAGIWIPLTRLGKNVDDYHFLEKRLSLEPYSIGLRKDDPKFKELVDRVTRRMIQGGEMAALYKKWFSVDQQGMLPMSLFMKEALRRPSDMGVEQIAF
ncbi:amino acid ABC transporter substrate-binding protein [Acidovorax sp. NCPPB 3576]|uniref:amino acid ABC transporter substrate-binding protein n=1 Tax=Acidovorax sp. NCPPB 3576 TaxID=2940488 RepID=UPI002349534B|nr:amino acid ABC transporter substrate-binding protein [Acidovorax sp. NCPPB 3576]WCM86894.1 amino acid ABC transporter substrate-binding protein [Acidovorax sp. NCPPB 3576]